MTTIHVSDDANARIEDIQDDGGHKSKDSVLRELIHAYDQLNARDAPNTITVGSAVGRAYDELGLHYAQPFPAAALVAGTDDLWTDVFTLYLAGPWLQNDRLANDPPALSVLYADGAFLFEYTARPHRYIDGEADDITSPGTYHFVVDAADYENELLNILSRSAVHQFLAPTGGVPTEFDADGRPRPTFGGWGRTVTADQAAALYDLPTVDEVRATPDDSPVQHDEWTQSSSAPPTDAPDRTDTPQLTTPPTPE